MKNLYVQYVVIRGRRSTKIECPICHVGADKFKEQTGERGMGCTEHVVGAALRAQANIMADLFNSEARVPRSRECISQASCHREGYPERSALARESCLLTKRQSMHLQQELSANVCNRQHHCQEESRDENRC